MIAEVAKKKKSSSKTPGLSKPSTKSDKESSKKKAKEPTIELVPHEAIYENADFEAGILFSKYDKNKAGALTAEDFRNIWREATRPSRSSPAEEPRGDMLFEAGLVFSRFQSGDGKLSKEGFEKMIKEFPHMLHANPPPTDVAQPSATASEVHVPKEVVTGLLLTHYDETAGVPLARAAVSQHKAMGHMVGPLSESYKARYDKLRHLLTSKLLPRREQLLQLRRQLQNSSVEVAAAKRSIERETLEDTEHILERLREAESSRQSAVKHQVLALDEELGGIERVMRRIELSSDRDSAPSGLLVTSVASGVDSLESYGMPRATRMVELIQEYADLMATIEHLASKQLSVRVDFSADDFPRETSKRLDIIARCDKYSHALAVKDQMLWTALQEVDRLKAGLAEEQHLCQEYAEEVAKWADMTHTLASQLHEAKHQQTLAADRADRLVSVLREHNIYLAEGDEY